MTKDELLEAATSAKTGLELWRLLLRYCKLRGIQRVSYHHHGRAEHWGEALQDQQADPQQLRDVIDDIALSPNPSFHIMAHGFQREWVESYVKDRLYEIDPIPEIARRTSDPFLWSDAKNMAKLEKEQAQYLETLDMSKVGDGVAIQVFGPNMRNGYFGFGFGDSQQQVTPARLAEFQLVAQLLHLRGCTLLEQREGSETRLSPREREVLGWMARGKSKSVIADILGISVHTVDTTVRRIFGKLSVSDRTSAILRAVSMGLIPAAAIDVA